MAEQQGKVAAASALVLARGGTLGSYPDSSAEDNHRGREGSREQHSKNN